MNAKELLDIAEKAGIENLKARLETTSTLAKEASGTLTLLLAAMAGTLAFAAKSFDSGSAGPIAWGAAVTCGWLTLLSAVLVGRCLMIGENQSLYNDPGNLYQPSLNLTAFQVREFELENLKERIKKTVQRNNRTSKWLNLVRGGAIATPIWFSAAAWLAAYR